MAAMVIVNNPGDWSHVYWPLLHAPWEGCTPTDLIFPFFLFIVGVAITLSRKTAASGAIVRRAAMLVALGLLLTAFPRFDVTTLRVPGVLQRIGLCYFSGAFAYRWARGAGQPRRDAEVAWRVGALAAVSLVGYWLLLLTVPGATGQRFDLSPEGNIGAIVDRAVFGRHTWKPGWDPEGLLSTLPAIGTTLVGLLAGVWMRASAGEPARLARGLALGGLVAAVAGGLWALQFPMIKNIWTSSYALFTAGVAALVLAASYWVLDVCGWRAWARPLVVLGVNAITLFVVSGLVAKLLLVVKVGGQDGQSVALKTWLYRAWFEPWASPVNASLAFAVANLALLYALLAWMYRRGVFLKV